jgi:hypothetical protein
MSAAAIDPIAVKKRLQESLVALARVWGKPAGPDVTVDGHFVSPVILEVKPRVSGRAPGGGRSEGRTL